MTGRIDKPLYITPSNVSCTLTMKSKHILTILMLTCISCISFSQTEEEVKWGKIVLPDSMELKKISLSDSVTFNKVAAEFLKAFKNKDTKKIKSNSLELIHCQLCTSKDNSLIIPVDSFIKQAYQDFDDFLYGSIKKEVSGFQKC
ncbi:MAG: hypothetical protein JWP12_3503 [Bacteroidetes bacterium]|nr:hypothetical protein [Bacteroidota bacterium]